MKALTILQPWAEMVTRGVKLVENRIWETPLSRSSGDPRR